MPQGRFWTPRTPGAVCRSPGYWNMSWKYISAILFAQTPGWVKAVAVACRPRSLSTAPDR